MIPHRLHLRNFMCYGEDVSPLSFEGFHVACLSGDNGHGKSALLDAMTWCLWGRSRARSDDELVRVGRSEMEVEFEFEMGDNRYRVVRKRSLRQGSRRAQGSSILEYHVFDDGDFRPITGNSIADTQRLIVETLHMDYDTFINSAFIVQGRADEFTVKPPADRKRVLAEILGLSQYDAWEDRAREVSREREAQRRELATALQEIDRELERKPEHESEHASAQAFIATVEAEVKRLDAEVTHLRGRKREMAVREAHLAELEARVRQSERELAEVRARLVEHERRLSGLGDVVSRRDSIQSGYARLTELRALDADLSGRATRFAELGERRARVEGIIAEAGHKLRSEATAHEAAATTLRARSETSPAWGRELADVEAQLERMSKVEADLGARRDALQHTRQQLEALKTANERLRSEMALLKEKIDLLAGASATCPLCGHPLGKADRDHLQVHFGAQGRELGDEYRANATRMKDLERAAEAAQREVSEMEGALRDRVSLQRRHAVLEKSLADAAEFATQAASRENAAAALRERLLAGDFARSERGELARLQAEARELSYTAEEHARVRAELASLAGLEALKARLEAAEARLADETSSAERERRASERWESRLAGERASLKEAREELADLPRLTRQMEASERDLDRLLAQQSEARQRLGRAQQMLNHCRYLEGQRDEKQRLQTAASHEKSIYDDLALAFGKKGIQAMLIESAIPEIEREANDLLTRMTDGALSVGFETQRDAKTQDGVIETLDIRVADELGERAYETYSGGEAFRVNFAIRIALSKLLARRAGAKLQTLIVDEGFGTQDAQGRERLVEAINNISADFEKILVITHIQELKDAFPVRIEVVKGAEGTQVRVV